MDRVITTGPKTAYLKIAEGCSNKCTYCAIPYIRGKHVSRKMEDILEEAKMLADKGIEEVIVIAQDTTKYGIDLYNEYKLPELLTKLSKIDGFKWIRFLYSYPESITDELIKVVKENDKICKYFDIPMQHFADGVLKRMNRKSNSVSIENTINKIREEIPNVILRTTFIVGFPGETEEDFFELYEFVNRAKFEKLGAFKYSKEEGTPAARLKEQIHLLYFLRTFSKHIVLKKKSIWSSGKYTVFQLLLVKPFACKFYSLLPTLVQTIQNGSHLMLRKELVQVLNLLCACQVLHH